MSAHSLQGMYPKCFQRLFSAASQKGFESDTGREICFLKAPFFHAFICITFIDLNQLCVKGSTIEALQSVVFLLPSASQAAIINSLHSRMYRTQH